MRYFKAVVAYDGTDFLGFQVQAKGRTVQGELETGLQRITGTPMRLSAAGRTDTGVHAIGQVIAFRLLWRHPLDALQRALNTNLPEDIRVLNMAEVDDDFHPRFSAKWRQYRYTILNQPQPDVLLRRVVTHIAKPLNVTAMNAAAEQLLGTHDFASFGKPPQGNNSVRTIQQAVWSVDGPKLYFEITANAFLYRMVRNIVGTLIQIGLGRLSQTTVTELIAAQNRTVIPPPAPPNGLCLMNVEY